MPLFRLLQHIAAKDSIAILKTTIEASFPSEVLLFLFFLSGFNILFHLWKKCISCCRHLFYMLLENVLGGQVPYQCFQISLIFVKVLNKLFHLERQTWVPTIHEKEWAALCGGRFVGVKCEQSTICVFVPIFVVFIDGLPKSTEQKC